MTKPTETGQKRTKRECYCCGRSERRLWPLIQSNSGLVCACDSWCRRGTDRNLAAEKLFGSGSEGLLGRAKPADAGGPLTRHEFMRFMHVTLPRYSGFPIVIPDDLSTPSEEGVDYPDE